MSHTATWLISAVGMSIAAVTDSRSGLSVLALSGLGWTAPDYSTVSRRQKRLEVQITARPSRGGLHLLVDSTGLKMLGEGEWKTRKHGAEYWRQWRKVHLGIDAET